ncbi:MAG: hypothetical protein JO354_07130 [Verrucomicrobia bacterium]|nr:hypothetical protein [Verrucomicrobiota bacterium]
MISALLIGVIGLVDFSIGYERSLLLPYLLPITLATWCGGGLAGFAAAVLSTVVSIVADIASGVPNLHARYWNAAMGLACYAAYVLVLAHLAAVLRALDRRVRERTAAMRREVAERKRLNVELQRITTRERERIGQELHDSLCQHLTGTALVAQSVAAQLRSRESPLAGESDRVVKLVEQGIDMSRNIARGLFTPELAATGLASALEALASETSHARGVACTFDMTGQVNGGEIATQLYRIAHEAVTNALKHAKARTIQIHLDADHSETTLTVADDGVGICTEPFNRGGLGLSLMRHGAASINSDLQVRRGANGGTIVTCHVRRAP